MEARRGEGVPGLAHAGTLSPVLPDGVRKGISEEAVWEQRGKGKLEWHWEQQSPNPSPYLLHTSPISMLISVCKESGSNQGLFCPPGDIPGHVQRL